MSILVKTTSVIRRYDKCLFGRADGGPVISLKVDQSYFDDMGLPDTITVTIEPGDKLNEDGVPSWEELATWSKAPSDTASA